MNSHHPHALLRDHSDAALEIFLKVNYLLYYSGRGGGGWFLPTTSKLLNSLYKKSEVVPVFLLGNSMISLMLFPSTVV